jgi:type IV secretion system protein VirD4
VNLAAASTGGQVFKSLAPVELWLLGCMALLAAAALLIARGKRPARMVPARFASRSELRELHLKKPEPGRMTLGVHQHRMIAAEPRASVLVIGPSQSGKTTGLVVPALLEWAGPAVSTSVKSDVVKDTHAARARRGEVRVFDPTGATGLSSTPWSPLSAAGTWEGARRTAARLLGVGENGPARSADESFWRPAGARYLAPLLLAAAHGELTMREVLSWAATTNEDEPTELLAEIATEGAKAALEALQSVWESDPRFRSSLTQTVSTALDAWHEPAIAAATVGGGEINASWLLAGQNTLYLISPAEDQRRLRGLFTALLSEITTGAFHASTQTGKPIDPALLLALDEAANIAPLPNLDEIASTGPGQGVQLLTVLQNISQASDRWGSDRAQTIIANHRARMFCPGIGDQATLEHLQRTLGEQEIPRTSTSRQGPLHNGSRTVSSEFRALAPAHQIRQAQPDTALLVYGRLAPAWLKLQPWYSTPALRALALLRPAPSRLPSRLMALNRRRRPQSPRVTP